MDLDPKVNEYLYGEATADTWDAFKQYLIKSYGKSHKSKASTILDGIKREGQKPSQLCARIKDKAGDVTIDQLIKEMVIRELPPSVQRAILDKSKEMTSEETAELADQYFEKDGRPSHREASSINVVESPTQYTTAFDDAPDDEPLGAESEEFQINAIRGRYGHQRQQTQQQSSFNRSNRSRSRPSANQGQRSFNQARGPSGNGGQTNKDSNLCRNHRKFGDAAYKCLPGCIHFGKQKNPNGQPPRRQ